MAELAAEAGNPFDPRADRLPVTDRPRAFAVADVTKYLGPATGGIRTYLLEKARFTTATSDLRQVLLAPGARSTWQQFPGVVWYRLAGPRIPFQPPYRFLVGRKRLGRILRHERPDVIEVGSPFLVPWLVRSVTRDLPCRRVWFYHGNFPRIVAPLSVQRDGAQRWRLAAAQRYAAAVARTMDAVVVAGEHAARDLEAIGVGPLIRTTLGVDLDNFRPDRSRQRDEIRQREDLPPGPLAVYLGRIAGEKRLEVAIRAWPTVFRRTGARLALIGDGPVRRKLGRLVSDESVIWRPFVSDRTRVADILAAADLYLSPGPLETCGLAGLEALACGTPVLATGWGGGAELVDKSGAGSKYAVGDVASLEEAATSLMAADLAALGLRGREYVERHHDWRIVLTQLFTAYRRLAAT